MKIAVNGIPRLFAVKSDDSDPSDNVELAFLQHVFVPVFAIPLAIRFADYTLRSTPSGCTVPSKNDSVPIIVRKRDS